MLSGRGESAPGPGAAASFDAFDRSGLFVRRIDVLGDRKAGRDALFLAGDRVVVVVNGGPMGGAEDVEWGDDVEPDRFEIRCARLRAGP